MGSDRYLPFLPIILDWIEQTLDDHAHERRAVSSFNFPRLPHYFSEGLLNTASVVLSDRLPVPPLSALGLREFADFESQPASATKTARKKGATKKAAIKAPAAKAAKKPGRATVPAVARPAG